jgi:hypothetical protein
VPECFLVGLRNIENYNRMKYFIAHRGNVRGKNKDLENTPDYIDKALSEGYDVELDVWKVGDDLFLGHDEPETRIEESFLMERKDKLWCHAKNLDALCFLLEKELHCFFHDIDDYIITSKQIIWAYPGKPLNKNTICVMPEMAQSGVYQTSSYLDCLGVCSDNIESFRNLQVPKKT